jgi:hypothetical protein
MQSSWSCGTHRIVMALPGVRNYQEGQVMDMRFSVRCGLAFATLFVVLLPFTIRADVSRETQHARLIAYAGSYEGNQLLADPGVAPLLRRVAGDHLEHLLRNLNVVGSVDLVSGWLKLAGNAPHSGTEEEAAVCINPDGQVVHAAIFSKGQIMVLTELSDYVNLPLCIKDWITQVTSLHSDRLAQPANVRLESR